MNTAFSGEYYLRNVGAGISHFKPTARRACPDADITIAVNRESVYGAESGGGSYFEFAGIGIIQTHRPFVSVARGGRKFYGRIGRSVVDRKSTRLNSSHSS